ncbi:hypothetical protein G7046_g6473 [Stylonectria norvegica]|nr:hypothetical protein G7046_g6473 [Stylonectria norvegica]
MGLVPFTPSSSLSSSPEPHAILCFAADGHVHLRAVATLHARRNIHWFTNTKFLGHQVTESPRPPGFSYVASKSSRSAGVSSSSLLRALSARDLAESRQWEPNPRPKETKLVLIGRIPGQQGYHPAWPNASLRTPSPQLPFWRPGRAGGYLEYDLYHFACISSYCNRISPPVIGSPAHTHPRWRGSHDEPDGIDERSGWTHRTRDMVWTCTTTPRSTTMARQAEKPLDLGRQALASSPPRAAYSLQVIVVGGPKGQETMPAASGACHLRQNYRLTTY